MAEQRVYIENTKRFPTLLRSRKSFRRRAYNKGVPASFTPSIPIHPPLYPSIVSDHVCEPYIIRAMYAHCSLIIVGNDAARHTLKIFLLLFGWLLGVRLFTIRKCAEGSGICFGFGRVCLWGAFRTQGCAIVLGQCSFRESGKKSGSAVRSAQKSWKPGSRRLFAPHVSQGAVMGEGETHKE